MLNKFFGGKLRVWLSCIAAVTFVERMRINNVLEIDMRQFEDFSRSLMKLFYECGDFEEYKVCERLRELILRKAKECRKRKNRLINFLELLFKRINKNDIVIEIERGRIKDAAVVEELGQS